MKPLDELRSFKRVVTLESCLCDCGQFEESLQILEEAVKRIAELGYTCTVEDTEDPMPSAKVIEFRS